MHMRKFSSAGQVKSIIMMFEDQQTALRKGNNLRSLRGQSLPHNWFMSIWCR